MRQKIFSILVTSRFTMWALDAKVPCSIPDFLGLTPINLENELFFIDSDLGVLRGAPNRILLLLLSSLRPGNSCQVACLTRYY